MYARFAPILLALSLGACNTSSPLGALNEMATISFGPSTTGSITPTVTDYNPNTDTHPRIFVFQRGELLGWGRLVSPGTVFMTKSINQSEGPLDVSSHPQAARTPAFVAGEDGNVTTLKMKM